MIELNLHPRSVTQGASIARKLRALGLDMMCRLISCPLELRQQVQEKVQTYMKVHHRSVIRQWKKTSKTWKLSDASVYKYLRNPAPIRFNALQTPHENLVTHPWDIQDHLMGYWSTLENWDYVEMGKALEVLEDKYSLFLPHQPCSPTLLPHILVDVAKRARKTSTGLDAWTHAEVASLPKEAWHQLLQICVHNPVSLLMSVTSLFKRVPIPKTVAGVCGAADVRPIDVFSVILRVMASATTIQLRHWVGVTLHPGQYAFNGGVLAACARIAWVTELSYLGLCAFWGVSVDFQKMFNMMSPMVAAQAGLYMGLHPSYVMVLLFPIMCATGVWALPHKAAPLPWNNTRGLPQGMSTSVLFSELAIAPFLWRLSRVLEGISTVAYVDDINLVGNTKEEATRACQLLREFESDFSLRLSATKTKVWVSKPLLEESFAREVGFQSTNTLDALGGQWPLRTGVSPEFPKEAERLRTCVARLERARALQINPARLAHIVSAGCLSLVDYLNLPDHRPYLKVRALVKNVFGIPSAAPEVLVSVLQNGTLDPSLRWILAILRLWHQVLRSSPTVEDVTDVIETPRGRLGRGALEAFRWGIRVTPTGFELPDRRVSVKEEWFVARKVMLAHLKQEQARRLAMRRPTLYAGLITWNPKQHSKLLMSLSPLKAKILLKIWTGSIMCKHKRPQIYGESPMCACGHQEQTIQHLLWSCPLTPPPPVHLDHRRNLPPSAVCCSFIASMCR